MQEWRTFHRPVATLTGKALSAHTIATFLAQQGCACVEDLRAGVPMNAQAIKFLNREKAVSYWRRGQWLNISGVTAELTDSGIRKVLDRVNGKAGAQSVTREAVDAALDLILRGPASPATAGVQLDSEEFESFALDRSERLDKAPPPPASETSGDQRTEGASHARGGPLQNRVTPFGEVIAVHARGTLMGNRGQLHDGNRRLTQRRWTRQKWVTCRLDFKGRRRELMAPGRYTELFFLDEATALAAGHRPCGECRPDRFQAFVAAWRMANAQCVSEGKTGIAAVDWVLHQDRVDSRTCEQKAWSATLGYLPTGTMIALPSSPGTAWLVHDGALLRWSPAGYDSVEKAERTLRVRVLTPQCTVRTLNAGYEPELHPSVQAMLAEEGKLS